jgi:hydrogenase maturation protease
MIYQIPSETKLAGSILLIGFGNPGRLDDGLGPALAERIDQWCQSQLGQSQITVETCYQLAVEHAELVSGYDVVVFADADMQGCAPFQWSRIEPRLDASFTTHDVAPSTVLGLAHNLFGATTQGYLLAIRGYQFDDFGETLSVPAQDNLSAAVLWLQSQISGSSHNLSPKQLVVRQIDERWKTCNPLRGR